MAEKSKFGVFRVLHLTKMIFDRGKLFLECYWKREDLTFQNKGIHNSCAKCKIISVQAALKDF